MVKGQGWTADLYPKCYLLTAGLCTLLSTQYLLPPLLWMVKLGYIPYGFSGHVVDCWSSFLSISNDSLIVSHQTDFINLERKWSLWLFKLQGLGHTTGHLNIN